LTNGDRVGLGLKTADLLSSSLSLNVGNVTVDPRPKLLSLGTVLANAAVVITSVAGALSGPWSSTAVLVALAAAGLAVSTIGGRAVERAQRGHAGLLAVLVALDCAAVAISSARSTLILMPAICVAVIYFSVGTGLTLAAALTAFVALVLRLSPGAMSSVLNGSGAFAAAAVFVVIFSRLVVKERLASARIERLAADLEAKNQQLSMYAAQVEELATTQERNRIAREIHDGLGHYLSAAHMQLEAARALIGNDAASANVLRAQQLLHDGLGEVRRSVAVLRSGAGDRPFSTALTTLVEEARASGVTTELHIVGNARPLGSAVEFVLYRAAQEALTNVRRHAKANNAMVRIQYGDARVELHVEDDGVGAINAGHGFGLVGLRERVALVGGDVEIVSAASGGFALHVAVPT
jgi:signal transduction histidine kinase